ncbi:BZ3500_MvSof-1268-A1-R1_Chr4-4g07461 [Microbotryum saponariae]|uniref:BZ3500_MvSof-1268-A1-R1_Chr4-4g07461 protein n=1 Tax=Microbotryum saponariae TaxID=289078 RepID=A0A2X0MWG6_9BASI|nr:BZ3500_MvSof-1268-A1-R1_Chr4-4g07461 [Microbotryum saponariae]SDA07122.1 BZ3501_MvSof-1269-A2-R1_Chr4-3g07169 [Microbotryum saponariae]
MSAAPPSKDIAPASLFGVPLGLISLVTLTCQNSALTIVLHYSRIRVPADRMYSAAEAVLLNELLKGSISFSIALYNTLRSQPLSSSRAGAYSPVATTDEDSFSDVAASKEFHQQHAPTWQELCAVPKILNAAQQTGRDIFSSDCWKLSIPACLYVIQNNLQFVAASNLDVPTFQVTYNLKILTTALFSVILLRKRLSAKKWLALFFLAAGVGVVQLQSTAAKGGSGEVAGHAQLDRFKGLVAVGAACMTSGLAGVYFELVLKGSKVDLWVRNVQLSFFSLLPALLPVFFPDFTLFGGGSSVTTSVVAESRPLFAYFGLWAWAVVLIQVVGGLVTALVIKFSDNIMKGFATSLAIILSFIAGMILFNFRVTPAFLVGTCIVVGATYLYNQPDPKPRQPGAVNNFPLAHVHAGSNVSAKNFGILPANQAVGSRPAPRIETHRSSDSGSAGSQVSYTPGVHPATYRRSHQQQGSISGPTTPDITLPGFGQSNGDYTNLGLTNGTPGSPQRGGTVSPYQSTPPKGVSSKQTPTSPLGAGVAAFSGTRS